MANPILRPKAADAKAEAADRGSPNSTPRWPKIAGIVVGVVVLLVVLRVLTEAGGFDLGSLHSRIRAMVGH